MLKTDNMLDGLNVDKITSGYVIDHIKAGYGMSIYKHLRLDELDCSIALIQNVKSSKYGRKDIIKIQGLIDIDMDMLGYIDPNITVITVKNHEVRGKQTLKLPVKLTDVVKCKNPRCITSNETSLSHEFRLTDRTKKVYRCVYCEQENK
ncbi:MAG: aspartate carbamoyltransferase regulatory subunit [Defluviitaleaceae bacterium]|nr:aspartate carbamoyltransferase regulatory subunit [Defluviitaleaceae bacterium]MCL2836797.1 aspartate carbamoyltransferase regulatory subunit [Defluviitaleaceae bacterium]